MKEIQYKEFSWETHKKNWQKKRPNVCQFELTFKCDFHCIYCYSDCYNRPNYIRKELSTKEVKFILDKVYKSGVIWLCLTGGDPLKREDFLEIYSYAKDKGFIITIFTNGYSLTSEIAEHLKDRPPFVVEITLNAVTKETFEEISQVRGSFKRYMQGLEMLIKRKVPLKIKTMIMRNNLAEISKIKEFVEELGLVFRPSPMLYARLNGDPAPCSLRIRPEEVLDLNKRLNSDLIDAEEKDCNFHRNPSFKSEKSRFEASFESEQAWLRANSQKQTPNSKLFRCNAGGRDGVLIDPYGKMISCFSIREPTIDLLKSDIEEGLYNLFPKMRQRGFKTNSRCRNCQIADLCNWCPGKALLETGDMESPIEWFCELAHLVASYKPQAASRKLGALSLEPKA